MIPSVGGFLNCWSQLHHSHEPKPTRGFGKVAGPGALRFRSKFSRLESAHMDSVDFTQIQEFSFLSAGMTLTVILPK